MNDSQSGSANDILKLPPVKATWWRQLIVITCLGLMIVPSIRGYLIEDSRFAWGMFAENVENLVEFYWVKEDGTRVRYIPPDNELVSKARQLVPAEGRQKPTRHTRYGLGTIRKNIRGYQKYLMSDTKKIYREKHGFIAIEAKFYYGVNRWLSRDHLPKYGPELDDVKVGEGRLERNHTLRSVEKVGEKPVIEYLLYPPDAEVKPDPNLGDRKFR